jgi:dUTPase
MKTTKIKKITLEKKQTYDITVNNNHNFFCNSHLIHNCGYLGEVKVIVFNTNPEPVTIKKGMKVAQAVLCPVVNGKWVELNEVKKIKEKDRGSNGFGSTGI